MLYETIMREHAAMTKEEAIAVLIGMGFLKFVPEDQRPEVRDQLLFAFNNYDIIESKFDDDLVSTDRRSYPADTEDLAEEGIGEHILRLKGVLAAEGVTLHSVADHAENFDYRVTVNGETYLIYDDYIYNHSVVNGIAQKRFLEIVDALLRDAGSDERLYAIYGGNEGRVIFLTEEMFNFLKFGIPKDYIDMRWMPCSAEEIDDRGSRIWS
jgi:hypothetical protein